MSEEKKTEITLANEMWNAVRDIIFNRLVQEPGLSEDIGNIRMSLGDGTCSSDAITELALMLSKKCAIDRKASGDEVDTANREHLEIYDSMKATCKNVHEGILKLSEKIEGFERCQECGRAK